MMLNSILTASAFTDSRFGEQSDNPLICRKYIRNIINYRLHVWMLVWCLFQNINDYLSELILKLQFFIQTLRWMSDICGMRNVTVLKMWLAGNYRCLYRVNKHVDWDHCFDTRASAARLPGIIWFYLWNNFHIWVNIASDMFWKTFRVITHSPDFNGPDQYNVKCKIL